MYKKTLSIAHIHMLLQTAMTLHYTLLGNTFNVHLQDVNHPNALGRIRWHAGRREVVERQGPDATKSNEGTNLKNFLLQMSH